MATVHLLANPSSRRGASDASTVEQELVALGHRVETIETEGEDDVSPSISEVGPDRVVLVGGDGLIHRALPALVEAKIPVGIVPSGSGNDFARGLGLPKRRSAAIRQAVAPAEPVDVLRVEHSDGASALVASVVTAGFSGRVNATANERTFPRGQLKYTVASFAELRRFSPFELGARGDAGADGGLDIEGSCSFFAVANTRCFGGGMAIAPSADGRDGRLDLTIVRAVPAWQLALVLPAVFVGQHVRHPQVEQWSGAQIALDHDEQIWGDGEHIGAGPMTVSVVPQSLLVAMK